MISFRGSTLILVLAIAGNAASTDQVPCTGADASCAAVSDKSKADGLLQRNQALVRDVSVHSFDKAQVRSNELITGLSATGDLMQVSSLSKAMADLTESLPPFSRKQAAPCCLDKYHDHSCNTDNDCGCGGSCLSVADHSADFCINLGSSDTHGLFHGAELAKSTCSSDTHGDHSCESDNECGCGAWCDCTTGEGAAKLYCVQASPTPAPTQATPAPTQASCVDNEAKAAGGLMVPDASSNGKACPEGSSRVFDRRGSAATMELCNAKCKIETACIVWSGVFNVWCIGCNIEMTLTNGATTDAVAYRKTGTQAGETTDNTQALWPVEGANQYCVDFSWDLSRGFVSSQGECQCHCTEGCIGISYMLGSPLCLLCLSSGTLTANPSHTSYDFYRKPTQALMVADASSYFKACQEGSSRVFDLRNSAATMDGCNAACSADTACIVYSGVFNVWCIGCNIEMTLTNTATVNAVAYRKAGTQALR